MARLAALPAAVAPTLVGLGKADVKATLQAAVNAAKADIAQRTRSSPRGSRRILMTAPPRSQRESRAGGRGLPAPLMTHDFDVRQRLLQLRHARIRHLRAVQPEEPKLRQSLQMRESGVRHLRVVQVERFDVGQSLEMH